MDKKRILSGVQPTGRLHIGNYIGALSVWTKEQDQFDGLYCVVDMHAFTIPEKISPVKLKKKVWETVAIYIACGIDPVKSTIFIQSMVPQHSELAWYLTCVTPMGWLDQMVQFKSKSASNETIGTGLYSYPILQAADILLYDTSFVPVGDDQKQHIELTRDIAKRFNHMFGKVFRVPQPMIREVGARIMALDDPDVKMSKSTGELKIGHSIGVVDDSDIIIKAIKSAKTDSGHEVSFDNGGPGVKNLLTIHQAITGWSDDAVRNHFNGKSYGFLKSEVAESVVEGLRPIREKYNALMQEPSYLSRIATEGAERAQSIARLKLYTVKEALGIDF
jgi:tryptophanyl-tRNA synthetase